MTATAKPRPRPYRLLRGASGPGWLALTTPYWNLLILTQPWIWLRPGRYFCDDVAGSLIVKWGPFLLTVWDWKR